MHFLLCASKARIALLTPFPLPRCLAMLDSFEWLAALECVVWAEGEDYSSGFTAENFHILLDGLKARLGHLQHVHTFTGGCGLPYCYGSWRAYQVHATWILVIRGHSSNYPKTFPGLKPR